MQETITNEKSESMGFLKQIESAVDKFSLGIEAIEKLKKTTEENLKSLENSNIKDKETIYNSLKQISDKIKEQSEDIEYTKKILNRPEVKQKNYDLDTQYKKEFYSRAYRAVKGEKNNERIDDKLCTEVYKNYIIKNESYSLDPKKLDFKLQSLQQECGNHYIVPWETKFNHDLNAQVNPEGGYLTRTEYANFAIGRTFDSNNVRAISRTLTTNQNTISIPIWDQEITDVRKRADLEKIEKTEALIFQEVKLSVQERYCMPTLTWQLMEDASIPIDQFLQTEVQKAIARSENLDFLYGLGDTNKEPNGILTYEPWAVPTKFDNDGNVKGVYETGKVEVIETENANNITEDDLKNLYGALRQDYYSSSVWIMNPRTLVSLMKIKNGIGDSILTNGVFGGVFSEFILGRPIVKFDNFPEISGGEIPIAFGSFNGSVNGGFSLAGAGYTIAQKGATTFSLTDPYTQKGATKYLVRTRSGGIVTSYDSFKLLKIKAS